MKFASKATWAGVAVSVIGLAAIAGSLGTRSATAEPAPTPAPAPKADGTFEIDGVHSSVVFKIKHMNVSNFYGVFKDVSGSFTTGDSGSVNVTVKADSVDSRNAGRDKHIKSPDFFSAKEFPEITFTAKSLKKEGESAWKGKGELNFRGVKKEIDVTLTGTGTGKGRGGEALAGVETRFTIKRSDFGNSTMVGPLSDEVEIIVALEGAQK